jgi:hypothetical protein
MKKTPWVTIVFLLFESPIMDVFPYFSGEEGTRGNIERFTKASKNQRQVNRG